MHLESADLSQGVQHLHNICEWVPTMWKYGKEFWKLTEVNWWALVEASTLYMISKIQWGLSCPSDISGKIFKKISSDVINWSGDPFLDIVGGGLRSPDGFQNIMGTLFSEDPYLVKFSWRHNQ